MSEEIIDHYVDRAGVSDDTKFITGELKSVLDLFDKVNAKKINLGGAKGMKDISSAAKELKGVMDSLQKTAEAYNKTQLQEAKLRKENALTSKAEAQARKENAAAAIKEKQALDESGKEREKEKKRINEIGRAYIEYSKAAREASLKAKAYALTLGESNPVTIAAVKNAKEMNDILLRVDRAVGQNQRNVGNYKSAFDGLSVSFSQVARELPSLAVSAQTFALAISNNLPWYSMK
jgi:phage-related tail protein